MELFIIKYRIKFVDGSTKTLFPNEMDFLTQSIKENPNLKFVSWTLQDESTPFWIININNIVKIEQIKKLNF